MTLVLVLYLPRRGDMALLSLAVMVAYPASLFAAACVGLIAMPTLRLKFSWSYRLFLASLIATGGCWMVWNSMALDGATIDGSWFNSLFSFSVMGMGLATLYWNIEPSRNARIGNAGAKAFCACCRWWLSCLPGLAVVLSHPRRIVPLGRQLRRQNIGAFIVVILAMFKQSTLLREHDLLKIVTRNLEESEQQKHLILDSFA